MKVRLTTKEDYTELSEWWRWWRWSEDTKPTIDLLDDLRFGMIVSDDEVNICAGFIYFTNAKAYCLMEFIVSNPKVKGRAKREEAKDFLISCLLEMAKKKGAKVVYSSLRSDNLLKNYKNCGFVVGSKNTKEMVCSLNEK